MDDARADTAHRPTTSPWAGLPASSAYHQRRLIALDTGENSPSDASDCIRRSRRIDPAIHACLAAASQSSDTLIMSLLGACHLVVQWYLGDDETVIGTVLPDTGSDRSGSYSLRASYLYVEDEQELATISRDIRRQLDGRVGLVVSEDSESVPFGEEAVAPAFFLTAAGAAAKPPACSMPVSVHVGLGQSMDPVVTALIQRDAADRLDIDAFLDRLMLVADMLAHPQDERIEEVRRRLGDPLDVPCNRYGDVERRLIAIWATVLAVSANDIHAQSNYFQLGGTSLNAFKLVNRIRAEFEQDVSLLDVMDNPTVRELAKILMQ